MEPGRVLVPELVDPLDEEVDETWLNAGKSRIAAAETTIPRMRH
jgi:hypothetical protein